MIVEKFEGDGGIACDNNSSPAGPFPSAEDGVNEWRAGWHLCDDTQHQTPGVSPDVSKVRSRPLSGCTTNAQKYAWTINDHATTTEGADYNLQLMYIFQICQKASYLKHHDLVWLLKCCWPGDKAQRRKRVYFGQSYISHLQAQLVQFTNLQIQHFFKMKRQRTVVCCDILANWYIQ